MKWGKFGILKANNSTSLTAIFLSFLFSCMTCSCSSSSPSNPAYDSSLPFFFLLVCFKATYISHTMDPRVLFHLSGTATLNNIQLHLPRSRVSRSFEEDSLFFVVDDHQLFISVAVSNRWSYFIVN